MRTILFLLTLLASGANAQTTYTLSDVAKHATQADCWMVMGTTVYDFSPFIAQHPGGTGSIGKYCGADGSNAYAAIGHSQTANQMEFQYKIGTLSGAPPVACTYSYSSWGTCPASGVQTRTLLSSTPQGCTGTPGPLSQACTPAPPPPPGACVYTYSNWSACAGGTQSRTVTGTSPQGCSGSPTLTQSCTIVPPPPPVADAMLPGTSISDHFARHGQFVKDHGSKMCSTCHVAGGTANAHHTIVAPTYPGQKFTGPKACYLAPWGSPAFMHPDPMGTEKYPSQICSDKVKGVAVFATGTAITCASCHGDHIGRGRDD